jgi:hypothetical protein
MKMGPRFFSGLPEEASVLGVTCVGFLVVTGLAVAQTQAGSTIVPAGASAEQSVPVAPPTVVAQEPAPPAPVRVNEPVPPAKSRYLVQVMEGVFQNAVRYAATEMNRKLQAVSPDLLQLSGAARARGFRLDGYGVFFDVEVPAALRQTMGWTARMLQQQDQTLERAIVQLRRLMGELDGKRRLDAETALKLLELRARPFLQRQNPYGPLLVPTDRVQATSAPSGANQAADAVTTGNAISTPRDTELDRAWMQNPDSAYEVEVRDALIGAMLAHGSTLALQPDEWLTVAARDNQSVVVPGDLTETVTVILRIKGSDLTEFAAGRLSEADARRRVEVREF